MPDLVTVSWFGIRNIPEDAVAAGATGLVHAVDATTGAIEFGFETYAQRPARLSIEETIRDGTDAASNAKHPAAFGWKQARPERSYT